ncbi:MAG: hydroxyacid dehydrogenase, partial [Candidatus Eremiobacteraeota bacterium]|nr:hydroxyacid dehydrogenase [Candidatus Eremiobacteraeota bacterium]
MSARRPKALLAYAPERNPDTFAPDQSARLGALVELVRPEPVRAFSPDGVADALREAEVLVTGWGAPMVDAAALDAAPRLKLIAHLAGSVKAIVDPSVFARGIAVVNAA